MDKVAMGQVFLQVLRFLSISSIPTLLQICSFISLGDTKGPSVAEIQYHHAETVRNNKRTCDTTEQMRNAFKYQVGKHGRKTDHFEDRHSWEYDVKINLIKTGCSGNDDEPSGSNGGATDPCPFIYRVFLKRRSRFNCILLSKYKVNITVFDAS